MQRTTLEIYLDVWQITQQLKNTDEDMPIKSPKGHHGTGVRGKVWTLLRALKERTPDPTNVGFHPFDQTRVLYDGFSRFDNDLKKVLADSKQESPETSNPTLGPQLCRRLRGLAADLEDTFRSEVARHTFFLAPERMSLLDYLSPQTFLHNDGDMESFGHLPRIAQTNLEDAGKCLAYGLSGAAIGLSLQAVEATLRYYYWRHGGSLRLIEGRWEHWADWSDMLSWLNKRHCLPGGEKDRSYWYTTLDRLRDRYRNAVAHGRAYALPNRQEKDAEDIFDKCRSAALALGFEAFRRPHLTIWIDVHPDLDFDVAVATYLFYWNPELPPVSSDSIRFEHQTPKGKLFDSTVDKTVPKDGGDPCVSRAVMRYLQVQDNYTATLEPLIRFVARCQSGQRQSRFEPHAPKRTDVNLADLFEGIQLKEDNDPRAILNETWSVLDKFLDSGRSPEDELPDTDLVMELGQEKAYRALCNR